MIRIICAKCKNAYLKKEDGNLICPSCEEVFPESAENLLLGAQYYNEGNFSEANDCLMKYIVKNGADPEAIFYKALCDGFAFDEDTVSLKDMYTKILEALSEISDDLFIRYLALANDEAEKLEKLVAESHIRQFENADAEKIKKEVETIISLQNQAKEFRAKLTELTDAYNERATDKISVKFSTCYLVQPEIATEVGLLKFNKVTESIASHTVFTGILSTEIKNLEIYYRCIVMFFEKDRQKYDFLLESAEKFNELAKLLEEGRYASIKGVPTIANKLKSAAYDFFQESLKDHDDEFEQQTETVVVIAQETVEIPAEAEAESQVEQGESEESEEETAEYEDVYSTSDVTEITEADETEEVKETEDVVQESETVEAVEEASDIVSDEVIDTDDTAENVPEIEEDIAVIEIETEEAETTVPETEEVNEISEPKEAPVAEEETEEETVAELPEEIEQNVTTLEAIAENGDAEEPAENGDAETVEVKEEPVRAIKHKKSYGPFVAIILIILAVAGLIAAKVVPEKLNASNYEKAVALETEKKYAEAAEVFAKLGDYSDAEEKTLQCRYNNACALEAEKKYAEAKAIFASLGDYEDSEAKKNSCTYNEAHAILDAGKYDEAAKIFESLAGYADSDKMIKECSYKKAISLTNSKDYEGAIAIFTSLGDYSDCATKILEAKYGYATSNLNAENETTLSYLKDLASAKYKDSADLRNKLLGITDVPDTGVTSCINYSSTDTKTALTEVDKSKVIYFHVVVTEPSLYNKKLTVDYTTSMGYHDTKGIVLTESNNTYAFEYPSTQNSNYTVVFKLLSDDNTTLTTQKVLVK